MSCNKINPIRSDLDFSHFSGGSREQRNRFEDLVDFELSSHPGLPRVTDRLRLFTPRAPDPPPTPGPGNAPSRPSGPAAARTGPSGHRPLPPGCEPHATTIACGFADVQDCEPALSRKNPVHPGQPCQLTISSCVTWNRFPATRRGRLFQPSPTPALKTGGSFAGETTRHHEGSATGKCPVKPVGCIREHG